jgi:hypothetical protein
MFTYEKIQNSVNEYQNTKNNEDFDDFIWNYLLL